MAQLRLSDKTVVAMTRAQLLLDSADELKTAFDEFWADNLEFCGLLGDFTAVFRADHAAQIRGLRDRLRGLTLICEDLEPDPEPAVEPDEATAES